jgi:DNA polymerase III epsilon subunit-like protein
MANSMVHWNGNVLCAMDVETTGLDPHHHEIWQIAILPLDSNIEVRKDVMPFCIEIKPEHPERANEDIQHKLSNREAYIKACERGFDQEKAKDLLEIWIERLKLPCTEFGTPKRIMPLGQNFGFDKGFITRWLGVEMYNQYFDYHYADTMVAAMYLNDRAGMHAEPIPFSKINLTYLASTLKIDHPRAHTALGDCVVTAEVYKQMLRQGLLG